MKPFRVYDTISKQTWLVLNYQSNGQGSSGTYLLSLEANDETDGQMKMISAITLATFRYLGPDDE